MYAYKIKPKSSYARPSDDILATIKARSQSQTLKDLYLKYADLKVPEFIQYARDSHNNADYALPWRAIIEEILAIKGYNKTRLAAEIGVSRRTIKRWLDGETARPHNRSFARLFRVFCKVYCHYAKVNEMETERACTI